jgi:vacuolar-type H+-ATPase subunit H
MRTKKLEPLPVDPLDALATINGLAEEVNNLVEAARSYADNALDKVQDAAEKAEQLYGLLDQYFCDRRQRGEPEPKIWSD